MAQYIAPEVLEWIDHSPPGDEKQLALVPEEGAANEVESRAREYGITVDRCLPSGVILVTVSVGRVSDFVSTPAIQSVSVPDGMTIQQ